MSGNVHKTICWLVLVWFTLWMGVIMPGHTRGVVRLPGMDDRQADSACPCGDANSTGGPSSMTAEADTEEDAPADPAKCCAVCHLNATLSTPPPATLYTPYLGQLDEIAYLLCGALTTPGRLSPELYRGRPPPTA